MCTFSEVEAYIVVEVVVVVVAVGGGFLGDAAEGDVHAAQAHPHPEQCPQFVGGEGTVRRVNSHICHVPARMVNTD